MAENDDSDISSRSISLDDVSLNDVEKATSTEELIRQKQENTNERKRLDALAAKKKEIQDEATIAAVGAAAVGLVPSVGLALFLLISDSIDEDYIPLIPIILPAVASFLTFQLSVPSTENVIDAKAYDTNFAKNIRTTFASIPKGVLAALVAVVNNVINKITDTPSWLLGIAKVTASYSHVRIFF